MIALLAVGAEDAPGVRPSERVGETPEPRGPAAPPRSLATMSEDSGRVVGDLSAASGVVIETSELSSQAVDPAYALMPHQRRVFELGLAPRS